MQVTYTKSYNETIYKHVTVFDNLTLKTTNIFYEYAKLVRENNSATKEEIKQIIKEYKPEAKSKLRIDYGDTIEFFRRDRTIFPEFYII